MIKRLSNVNSRKAKSTIKVNFLVSGCVRTTNKVLFMDELAAEETNRFMMFLYDKLQDIQFQCILS